MTVLLLLAVAGLGVWGFWLMGRLDRSLLYNLRLANRHNFFVDYFLLIPYNKVRKDVTRK